MKYFPAVLLQRGLYHSKARENKTIKKLPRFCANSKHIRIKNLKNPPKILTINQLLSKSNTILNNYSFYIPDVAYGCGLFSSN